MHWRLKRVDGILQQETKSLIFFEVFLFLIQESVTSFYPIFNKRFGHLETLLTVHGPKNVLSAGSLCRPLVSSPQSKYHERTFIITLKVSCFSFKYLIIPT